MHGDLRHLTSCRHLLGCAPTGILAQAAGEAHRGTSKGHCCLRIMAHPDTASTVGRDIGTKVASLLPSVLWCCWPWELAG
jgi:hypothetical protein